MTNPALAHLLLASTSKSTSSSSFLFLLFIVAAFGLFYFLVLKPQQRKAQAARGGQGTGIEVGDEVQTVGGVIGTVLEIHGDRYTLLTGALGQDGNLDGPQPTRIVFVRQAIARKIERIEDVAVDDDPAAAAQSAGLEPWRDGRIIRGWERRGRRGCRRDHARWGGGGGVSPKSGGRAQRRQRRNLLISVLIVVAIAVGSFAAVFAAKWSPRLGLDLAGGVSVVYTAEGYHVSQSDLDETVNILNLRVNGLGVSGAQVQTSGKNQISVSIPGVTDAQQVLNEIGQTARMYFRPVLCYAYPEAVPKGYKGKTLPPGVREHPRLPVELPADRVRPGREHHHGGAQQQHRARPPVRGLPLDQRGEAGLRGQHRAPPGARRPAAVTTRASATCWARAR